MRISDWSSDVCSSDLSNLGGFSLSQEQREACIRLEDNNLLVASAGSGKSATMVGKVAYVLEKGLYQPGEILVLAFNKSAADELKERIAKQLGIDEEGRESVGWGKSVSVGVDLGGRGI